VAGSPKLLAIRGGAIGDFVLTLPALRLIRDGFPDCGLDVLGYGHIAELARGRFYADRVRSIEYGPLASFFSRRPVLSEELVAWFASYQQVVSWLFDPDGIFEANLRAAGVRHFINAWKPIDNDCTHAARQWAEGLNGLALYMPDGREAEAARLHPKAEDRAAARALLGGDPRPYIAIHPGSGSPRKNWPVEHWMALVPFLQERYHGHSLWIVTGEAEDASRETLRRGCPSTVRWLTNPPLPVLAAFLESATAYLGHDTGCSHIAAAVGTPSLLLFGPTNPAVWAPRNANVRVAEAPHGDLSRLTVEAVAANLP
jgi:heptosyltransferase-2